MFTTSFVLLLSRVITSHGQHLTNEENSYQKREIEQLQLPGFSKWKSDVFKCTK